MTLPAAIGRAFPVCLIVLVLAISGCGSDKLKRETEEKNKVIAQFEEYKKKAEADLAAKDQELRATMDRVEKLQRQNADTKRQLDNCGATVADLRDKVRSLGKGASKDKPAAKGAKTATSKSKTKASGR